MNKSLLRSEWFRLVCFGVFIALVFILLYVSGIAPIKMHKLGDSDCYMRLVRVTDLYNTGNWYDPVITRSNAPYGERLHWTRPFDVLLLAGSVPLSLFTGFETALFWWGVLIGPVLIIAAVIALQWSTRPILKADGPSLASLVFVFQMIIIAYFQAGRPDHHSLLIFLFIVSIGLALRIILRSFNAVLCYTAGVIGALSIWISIESMLPIFIIMAVLGFLWVLENGDFARKNLHFSFALFVFTVISMILERPWHDLRTQEFDRLSIIQCSIIGFVALFWIINSIFAFKEHLFQRTINRVVFVLAGAAAISLTTFICFPKFYGGPFADVDPGIIPIWLSKVKEVQPLFSTSTHVIQIQLFGSAVFSFAFLLYLIISNRRDENRNGWLFISFAAVVFVLISLYQIRWSAYAQVLLILPMAALMVLLRCIRPKTGFLKTLKNVSVLMLFSVGFLFIGLLVEVASKKEDSDKERKKIPLIEMCEHLTEAKTWKQRGYRILTNIDFGAEILYRTHHEVIGTPYHRNSAGILDTHAIMMAEADQAAMKLIQKRNIELILICPGSSEHIYYSKPEQASTFYQRLSEDIIPDWLNRIELPSELSSSFTLFEIIE